MAGLEKKKKDYYSSIGSLIQEILGRPDMIPSALKDELSVLGKWPQAVGPEIARQATPKYFKNGILFVETKHAIWTTELQMKSSTIKKKLNSLIGKEQVREIHFRQKKL